MAPEPIQGIVMKTTKHMFRCLLLVTVTFP